MMKRNFVTIISLISMLLFSCGESPLNKDSSSSTSNDNLTSSVSTAQGYHTVSFDSDGGPVVNFQSVKHGEKVNEPDTPSKEGYTFNGWTYKGSTWSFIGYVVTEDITLIASWEPIELTVDITNEDVVSGGRFTGANTYHYGDTVTLSAEPNGGYALEGWYENGVRVSTDTTYQFVIKENHSFKVKWKEGPYKLNLRVNDESMGTISIRKGTGLKGEEVTIEATPKSGYVLDNIKRSDNHMAQTRDHNITVSGPSIGWSNVYLFLWNYNGQTNADWPGVKLENRTFNFNDYLSKVPYTHFILSNGNSGIMNQCNDAVIEEFIKFSRIELAVDDSYYKGQRTYYNGKESTYINARGSYSAKNSDGVIYTLIVDQLITDNTYTFTMPNNNLDIIANFKRA